VWLQTANSATLADHDGQSMPSGQSAAHSKGTSQKKSPRSIVAGRREKQCYVALTAQPSSCKDVIELFLLSMQFFLFIQIPMLRPQISKRLAAAVSSLVNFHLSVSLQLQSLKGLEKRLLCFDGRVDFEQWNSARPSLVPDTLFPLRLSVHQLSGERGPPQAEQTSVKLPRAFQYSF
jgi:hypothetical protein